MRTETPFRLSGGEPSRIAAPTRLEGSEPTNRTAGPFAVAVVALSGLILGAPMIAQPGAADAGPSLKQLYEQHRWFELRDAIAQQEARPLYRGAVAVAFNDVAAAERYLNRTIALQPASQEAEGAHELLANLYIRFGRYRDATRQLDQALKIKPGRADLRNARALFAAWSRHPDQSAVRAAGSVKADVSASGIKLPLSIHGKTVRWVLDTGANFSVMSEAEAKSLGVPIDDSSANVADPAGGSTRMRTAVVDELSIGDAHLRNVAFLILPDSRQPMKDLKPGERGLIGIEVPLALGMVDWQSDGTFSFGGVPDGSASPHNLSFDELYAIVRGSFEGKELDCVLDSGNAGGSQFWRRFAQEFDAVLRQRGTNSKQRVVMVGGASERTTTMLPDMTFGFGGLNVRLRGAQVFPKPVGDDYHHCLLGLDVLSQAREVRIDFRSMSAQLRP